MGISLNWVNSFMSEVPIIQKPVRANQWAGFYMIGTSVMKGISKWSCQSKCLFSVCNFYLIFFFISKKKKQQEHGILEYIEF